MIPVSLAANPRLSRWIRFLPDRTVAVSCGKVELGQGISTALAQIAADALGVSFARVRMVPLTTGSGPDESLTAGSRSIQDSGAALRAVGAEVRALFAGAAGVPATDVVDGVFGSRSYWDLDVSLDVDAAGTVPPLPGPSVGESVPRLDLPDKVLGVPRYVHDLVLDGMCYGRIVRPASPGAVLRDVPVMSLPGVVEVVRDGSFLGVVAELEEVAVTAAALLAAKAVWDFPAGLPSPDFVLTSRSGSEVLVHKESAEVGVRTHSATYTRPYLAHASIAPSCAVARWDGDNLEVWCHSQGVYNLRGALKAALDAGSVVVHHVEGAGCYGHNGADDVAFDAARLAVAVPGRPVQVVWSRADELGTAPFGPAMAVRLSADLGESGDVAAWRQDTYGNGHVSRPGAFSVPSLLGAAYLAEPIPLPVAVDPPVTRGGGGQRNAVPLYTFPAEEVLYHRVLDMPLRTSAMRALGAFMNVFAIESFMDELALESDVDSVEYRLRHLDDPRARAVVEAAASRAGWESREPGTGFAFARYGNKATYCAVVASVSAEASVVVRRLTLAVDAGLVVNPDGLVNQIEGGAVQSTSWTVKEQVRYNRTHVTSTDWESYPILKFSEVPAVDVVVLNRPDEPSLGAGEAAQGPVAAAIGNALFDAIGVRVRNLPLTPEHIIAAMPE